MSADKKNSDHIAKFLKEAFCIDGYCKMQGASKITSIKGGDTKEGLTFKLTDSERGDFFVTISQ